MKARECDIIFIGDSDGDSVCLVGPDVNGDLTAKILSYGGDSAYYWYIVDSEVDLDDYPLLYTFTQWLRIYDYGLVNEFKAACIKIYSNAKYVTIIQLISEKKKP